MRQTWTATGDLQGPWKIMGFRKKVFWYGMSRVGLPDVASQTACHAFKKAFLEFEI